MRALVMSVAAVALYAGSGGGADNVATAAAGSTLVHAQPSPGSGPTTRHVRKKRHVKEHLCGAYKYRPVRIQVACGDGNARVVHLRWTEWTAARAVGIGTWQQNDCKPDCADGRFRSYPVRLALTEPMGAGPRRFFGRVVANFPTKAPPVPAYRGGHAVLVDKGRVRGM